MPRQYPKCTTKFARAQKNINRLRKLADLGVRTSKQQKRILKLKHATRKILAGKCRD